MAMKEKVGLAAAKRRKATRFRTDLPAHIRPAGHFTWFGSTAVNVSRTGICLSTLETFEVGLKVELEIQTQDANEKKQKRRMLGTIMWRRGRRYGIHFDLLEMKRVAAAKKKAPPKKR